LRAAGLRLGSGWWPARFAWVVTRLLLWIVPAVLNGQSHVKSLSNEVQVRNVFVVAHQDDWQLFMGDIAAQTVRAGQPATFVYLTAGDDGRDSVYWNTRERAALRSIQIAVGSTATEADTTGCTLVPVLEHSLRQCMVGNTRSFFLRLPDGKRDGTGYAGHEFQSMRRLRTGKIKTITAVDGSTSYQGWKDLVSTVDALIPDTAGFWSVVHTTDPSVVVNPHDHFDHRMAGRLIEDLRRQRNLVVRYYVGYALATRADNRSNEQARLKTSIFTAYDEEMMRVNKNWSAYREHPGFYSECMLRTYARSPGTR